MWMLHRCIYDPIPHPAGPGGNSTAASGVCHWSALEERQCGSVEINQPIPDGHWWVIEKGNKLQISFEVLA